jgi:L-glyceraldehyde 3-phosphate reductase
VASSTLAGGLLSGKYSTGVSGRMRDQLDSPRAQAALAVVDGLRRVAGPLGFEPAAVAIAYALANPLVASVLFGATSPKQVAANVDALRALQVLDPDVLTELRGAGPR